MSHPEKSNKKETNQWKGLGHHSNKACEIELIWSRLTSQSLEWSVKIAMEIVGMLRNRIFLHDLTMLQWKSYTTFIKELASTYSNSDHSPNTNFSPFAVWKHPQRNRRSNMPVKHSKHFPCTRHFNFYFPYTITMKYTGSMSSPHRVPQW